MFRAGGGVEQGLALGGHALVADVQHQFADALGDLAAAGLPGAEHVVAALAQAIGQQVHLGALAAAVRTLEADEAPRRNRHARQQDFAQRRHAVGDLVRAGFGKLRMGAIAVAHADGAQAHVPGGGHVELAIAHHRSVRNAAAVEGLGDQIVLVRVGGLHVDAHDGVKVLRKAEVVRDAAHEDLRLAAGDAQVAALRLQFLQQRRDAGVEPVLPPADPGEAFPVDVGGVARLLFAQSGILHERRHQRRPHEAVQHRLLRHGQAQLFVGIGHAAGDADAGLRQGAVQVKEDRVVFQMNQSHPILS